MKTIRREDGVEFVLKERLGSGLLGIVYRAENEQTGEEVAVKIPAPNLSRDQRDRFEQEYRLLRKLAEGKTTPNVPRAWQGRETEGRAFIKLLLLEYAPPPLQEQLAQLVGLEKERVAWKAGMQYATLLQDLHRAGYTCADRKLGDLRWDEANQRFVVLDWNVVRVKREAGVAEDLQLFGTIWYQLLTGRYRPNFLDPLNNDQWSDGNTSIGSRYLLQSLLNSQETAYSDQAVVEMVSVWSETLQESADYWANIGQKALNAAQQADQTIQTQLNDTQRKTRSSSNIKIASFNLDAEQTALVNLDLAQRTGHPGVTDLYHESLSLVRRRDERWTRSAELAFRVSQLSVGHAALKSAETSITDPTAYPDALLAVRRWQLLYHLGDRAIRIKEIDLRSQRTQLADLLHSLNDGNDARYVQDQLSALQQTWRLHKNAATLAQEAEWLSAEIDVREQLHKAVKAERDGQYDTALEYVQKAIQRLRLNDTAAPAIKQYVQAIKHASPFAWLHQEKQLQRKRDDAKLREELARTFSDPNRVPYTYLVQRRDELYRSLADNNDADTKEIDLILNAKTVREIGSAEYHQTRGNYLEMLAAIRPLLRQTNNHTYWQKLLHPYIVDATQHAQHLLQTQQYEQATELVNQLTSLQKRQTLWQM